MRKVYLVSYMYIVGDNEVDTLEVCAFTDSELAEEYCLAFNNFLKERDLHEGSVKRNPKREFVFDGKRYNAGDGAHVCWFELELRDNSEVMQ